MSISRDLASKFAKITNDNNKQTEETMYGTVVSQGGKLYVNLDGSDTITPIVTTAEIKSGERVAVMIKGHTATVIGNISNPGASTETTGKILDEYDVIVAKIGDFELIVADKITTEQLEAELAIIDELIAKKATIEELEAVKATIKDLDVSELWAELAEIEKAVIGKAEIEDLDATHAKIDILEADLAEIETLIGGNLTMDNIQSLILTSSKVTVDNAFIKDAMIDRVSASKLTAGTINTNLIQIGSEDGSLTINDSLQQFKDADGNVRIQIGKDATGDFTFALYGEDGQGQLINQNGITASAIGDGLIVNDMVADNAHISGDKLDISSVITEINGSTTTIDSSRIYLDQQNQSLSVAFNSLKDTVETIKDVSIDGDFAAALTKIETLTTELNVAKDNINTLVSNTTIVTQDGETIQMKDDYTTTKQTVNSINTKVGSLETTTQDVVSKQVEFEQSLEGFELTVREDYATKEELQDPYIGGRNMLLNSTCNLNVYSPWGFSGEGSKCGWTSEYKCGNNNSFYMSREGYAGEARVLGTQRIANGIISAGDEITLSGYYYIDSSIPRDKFRSTDIRIRAYKDGSDTSYLDMMIVQFSEFDPTDEWIPFDISGVVSEGYTNNIGVLCGLYGNGFLRFSSLKLEKGSKPTGWTAAPEDTDTKFGNYYTKSETDSKIKILNDSITMKVGRTELTETVDKIKIGGRNLLKKSNDDVSSSEHLVATYYFGDDAPKHGDTYTVTLKGTLGSDRTTFYIYNSSLDMDIGALTKNKDGLYSWSGYWYNSYTVITETVGPNGTTTTEPVEVVGPNTHLLVYADPSSGKSVSTIEWIKMEKGNKATDWSPAPEDMDDKLLETEKNMHDNIDNAVQDGVNTALTSLEDLYARKDSFDSFQTSVESQFTQTSNDIQMTFSEALVATNTVNDNLETYKAQVSTYIRFDTNGMEMGRNDSPFKSKLTNQKLAFTQEGNEVAYISNNKLYITEAEIIDNMTLGKWVWTIGTNGNLTLNWRG